MTTLFQDTAVQIEFAQGKTDSPPESEGGAKRRVVPKPKHYGYGTTLAI
jgi:hypothetical protein